MTTGVSTASLFLREMNEDALTVFKDLGVKCTEIFLTTFSEYTEEYARLLKERRLLPAEGPREEEDHFDLRFALSKLDAKRRQMVELKYFAGFSQKEIACALHLGESAVLRGLAAALNDLRGWLDEED